jgi:hypothetical protein
MVCDALSQTDPEIPCEPHVVSSEQTMEQIAALHGTTTWQIYNDNSLLASDAGMVPLRPNDVLAVRPSLGREVLRWQWQARNKEGAMLLSPCA